MAANVNEAAILTTQSNLPLLADLQYLEPYTSGALNRKMLGIILPGVFRGFNVTPGTGLNIVISSAADGTGAACIEVGKYQITVQQVADVTVAIPKGQTSIVLLEANYGNGVLTKQVNSSATLDAARFVVVPQGSMIKPNQIEICRVTLSASATAITQANITDTRTRRRVGPIISDAIDSTEQYQVASSNAVRLALAAGLAEVDKRVKRGELGIGVDGLELNQTFDWQTHVFMGGEYVYFNWSQAKNNPPLGYPDGYYQIFTLGMSMPGAGLSTIIIRPVNYQQPLAPFLVSWTGAAGSRVFKYRALNTSLYDINQVANVTPNTLNALCFVGDFAQQLTANALVANGYPVAEAGILKVMPGPYGVIQEYITYSNNRRFVRGMSQAKTFAPWLEHARSMDVVQKSGDVMTGQLKIQTSGISADAIRIYNNDDANDYGLIMRRSETNFYMIPTLKGQAKTGQIHSTMRPFMIALDTGKVTMQNGVAIANGLTVNGASMCEALSISGNNALTLGGNGQLVFPDRASANKASARMATYGVLAKPASGTTPAVAALDYRWELYANSVADPSYRCNMITFDIPTLTAATDSTTKTNATASMTVAGKLTVTNGIQVDKISLNKALPCGFGVGSISLGDNDTGLRWNVDGNFDLMSNAKQIASIAPGKMTMIGDLTLNVVGSSWTNWRTKPGAIHNETNVSNGSFMAMLYMNHTDRKFVLGGIGNQSMGLWMVNNSHVDSDTTNNADAGAWLSPDGWHVQGDLYLSATTNFQKHVENVLDPVVMSPTPWPGSSVPAGWLAMEGQTFDPNAYPRLKAIFGTKLPDMRDMAITGSSGSRAPLSVEQDKVKGHTHTATCADLAAATYTTSGSGAHTPAGTISVVANGAHSHVIKAGTGEQGYGAPESCDPLGKDKDMHTETAGSHAHTATFVGKAVGAHTHTVTIPAHHHGITIASNDSSATSENTIKNVAFKWIVRAR